MNFDDVLKTFIAESEQLLLEMEDALLKVEHSPHDPDIINAIFRAAHTIKGSAGLFGLDEIVKFTHVAESVLDCVRNGQIVFEDKLAALFLTVCDHISALIECASQGIPPNEETLRRGDALSEQLNKYLGPAESLVAPKAVAREAANSQRISNRSEEVQTDLWHISLRFERDLLRNGMDPLSLLRYLRTQGEIVQVITHTGAVPNTSELDPETCHLGFEVAFRSDSDKESIESVFDFVREDSLVRILPPHATIDNYKTLFQELPEDNAILAQAFLQCGTLTPEELQSVLSELSANKDHQEEISANSKGGDTQETQSKEIAISKPERGMDSKTNDNSLIRIDARKLDRLINLIGELIISGAGINLLAKREGIPQLVEATGDLSRLVEEVRDSALNLRMVQIGATFNRFQRVVRDISKELGKDIRLEISGAETELDKTVIEKIGDPLTHLVRNAMDHGIEPVEVRTSKGKSAQGTVFLNAYHDSGSIVIEVSDDGGGLNKDKILRKAASRGLIAEDQTLSDREIYDLIFEPGFSTADQVSNLSGRGVGMDVVKKNIQALRGTVELDNREGYGATVRIRLPLTLAIIDGFLIGVGSAVYVVPLDMVVECIELPRIQSSGEESDYLSLRGELLPFVRLRELFDMNDVPPSRRQNVVVVKYAGKQIGLIVDQLLGEFQTVIKPLGKLFSHLRGVSGFTILGGGEVALVLDVPGVVQQVIGKKTIYDTRALSAETR